MSKDKKAPALRMERLRVRRKAEAVELLGGKCMYCPCNNIAALRIDYLGGSLTLPNAHDLLRAIANDNGLIWEKYEVICLSCIAIRRAEK